MNKNYILFFFLFLIISCSKPKTVLICGDHVCINKTEAEQYFEENLSLEVKILNKKKKKNIDLVELNLKENKDGKKSISLLNKKNTNEQLKKLTKEEKNKIKKSISKKREEKRLAKKNTTQVKDEIDLKVTTNDKKANPFNKKTHRNKISNKNVNKNVMQVVDVCTILEKCSIEEISKFLLEQGKKKKFPDITARQ